MSGPNEADYNENFVFQTNRMKLDKIILLFLLIAIFAMLFILGGVRTYPDTESYLNMAPFREPGYGLILNAVKIPFGENAFWILGLIQNVLAVFSIYRMTVYIGDCYNKRYVLWVTAFILLMPYAATPVFASSGLILSNAMLSEGIALPLYILFFENLLKTIWEKKKKARHFIISLIFAFLLTLLRGQMLITFIAWLITAVSVCIREKKAKKILMAVLLLAAAAILRSFCVNGCNYIVNGKFTGTTYGPVTMLSNIIYVSDRADSDKIRDETLRKIFCDIYDIAQSGKMLYKDAPAGFTDEAAFYYQMHDNIKELAIYPYLQDYTENTEKIDDFMDRLIRVDELSADLSKELLPACTGRWLAHFIRNAAVGLIRTVAFVHPLFNIPALAGYLILILAGIGCFYLNRESRAVSMLLLTALLTAGNTAAVSMTIMCLSRYMIYNMAFIYISAFLLLIQIVSYCVERKKHG